MLKLQVLPVFFSAEQAEQWEVGYIFPATELFSFLEDKTVGQLSGPQCTTFSLYNVVLLQLFTNFKGPALRVCE